MQENTTAAQWKYLNTEQALQDVVFFADSFPKTSGHAANASSGHPNALPIHPSVVPWVWLGGSYPGVRGALLRQRNPETIFAAWASSAPVQVMISPVSENSSRLNSGPGASRHVELLQSRRTQSHQELFGGLGRGHKVIFKRPNLQHLLTRT
jgi:hypothetical protein